MTIKYLLVILLFLLAMQPVAASDNILNLYTWEGYIPKTVLREFEQETGIRVNHSTYVSNEVLYAKLIANPGVSYDVIMPSSYFVNRMIQQGLLQKLDRKKLLHLKNISSGFLNKEHDPHNEYSIPFLWNATGIAINTKYHNPHTVQAWSDLWRPQYRDQLLMLDDPREIFAVALLTMGYSVNERNPKHIAQAFNKLKNLMKNIKLFNTDAQRSIYLDEDITLGMGWNGDIYLAREENSALQFIYPKEGYVATLDCMGIPKEAKHVEQAYLFLDFILRPEIAKQISIYSGFSTTNSAAKALLPDKMRQDKMLYPDSEILARGQLLIDVGQKAATLYEKYFEWLKLENE